jgi:putative transposase
MPRRVRVVIPGCVHHVTQRGNHRQSVFLNDGERRVYLNILRRACLRHGMTIIGYCLMTNHVHLLVMPQAENSLAEGLGRAHREYALWHHVMQGLTGHLWQNRFYSCPLDEDHRWVALRYVELNPVRARLVEKAWDWPWSSARAHVGERDDTGLLDLDLWATNYDAKSWREVLHGEAMDPGLYDGIRRATLSGRPLGSDEFLQGLERDTGRSLRPQRRGRPKASQPGFKKMGKE